MARGLLVLTAAATALFAAMVARSSAVAVDGHRYFCLFDDAMISLRYARNLVDGHGLVWNLGERVEGFSNPLWTFVMAIAYVVSGERVAPLVMHVLGLACAAGILLLSGRLAGRWLAGRATAGLAMIAAPALLLATSYPLFYWCFMGMDTGPLALVALALAYLDVRDGEPRPGAAIPLLGAAACLLRPDALPLVALLGGYRLLRAAGRRGALLKRELPIFLAPLAAYQAFRLAYYEEWLPNTYYLKAATGMPLGERVGFGVGFQAPFLLWTIGPAIVVLALVSMGRVALGSAPVALASPAPAQASLRGRLALALAAYFVYVGYQAAVGGDSWPTMFRMAMPAAALLVVAFVCGVGAVAARFAAGRVVCALVLALAVVAGGRWSWRLYDHDLRALRPLYADTCGPAVNAALAIRDVTTPAASVAAFAAGTIPYYSRRPALDPLGRADAHVARLPAKAGPRIRPWSARLPGHNKYDLDYTFRQRRPTVIQLLPGEPCVWGADDLSNFCRFNYRRVRLSGVNLLFDNASREVRWERFDAWPPAPAR